MRFLLPTACVLLAATGPLPGSAWLEAQECPGCSVAQVERYRALIELEVGDLDGPVSLTRVEHIVVVGPRVYISQPREARIRVLSGETGELLEEFGGRGQGPGEFQGLAWIGSLDGKLTALDRRLRRITTFELDGELAGTRRFALPEPERPLLVAAWFPTADGHTIVMGEQGATSSGPRLESLPLLVSSERGDIVRRLPDAQAGRRTIVLRGDAGAMVMSRPLHTGFRFAMAPDASFFVATGSLDGDTLTLFAYDALDQRVDTIRTELAYIPVPPAVADSITEQLRTTLPASGPMGATLADLDRAALEEEIELPDRVPVVDEIFVAPEGKIWLREPNFGHEADRWRVIARDGTVRAEIEVPRNLVLRARDGDRLWSSRVDPAFGVTSIQRLRLEPVS